MVFTNPVTYVRIQIVTMDYVGKQVESMELEWLKKQRHNEDLSKENEVNQSTYV